MKSDFNLYDAFKIFDKYNLGELYKQDVEEGFNKLGVYAMRKEIDLFFKRYDSNNDHKLRYLEFSEAFTAKDSIYADHLLKKKSSYSADNPLDAFTYSTRIEFGDAIRCMLKCEGYAEEIRQNL